MKGFYITETVNMAEHAQTRPPVTCAIHYKLIALAMGIMH